jgi:hypothetical protein
MMSDEDVYLVHELLHQAVEPNRNGTRDTYSTISVAPKTDNKMSYEEALLYCQFCNHNGYTDWRLPTLDEYLSIGMHNFCWWASSLYLNNRKYVIPVRSV